MTVIIPIYQMAGGEVVEAAITDMMFRAAWDPVLSQWFNGDRCCPRDRLRLFLRTALGGPGTWDGPLLEPVHHPLHLTDEAFARLGGLLLRSLHARGMHPMLLQLVVQVLEPLRPHIVERPQ